MEILEEWSSWIKEGNFISYAVDGITYYERVRMRDLAHYEYDWEEAITAGAESGPYTPQYLEITSGYNKNSNTNHLWQLIFGMKGQAFIYIELPSDIKRHGVPKQVFPNSNNREVAHFTEWMSPFMSPSFITEHFMMREALSFISLDAYNPCSITLRDLTLNFFISKLVTERIGFEGVMDDVFQAVPSKERYAEVLDKLCRRVIPCRPITLMPVRGPAEATTGN